MGLQAECYNDGGPYLSWSHRTVEQSLSWGSGPYFIPALDMKAAVVYTNNPVCGAMRGFGANQTTFAMESILDMAARKIGMDPITIREINAMDYDKVMPTGQVMKREDQGINFKETLRMLRTSLEEKCYPIKIWRYCRYRCRLWMEEYRRGHGKSGQDRRIYGIIEKW